MRREREERRRNSQFDASREREEEKRTNEETNASVHHGPEQSLPVGVSSSVGVPELRLVLSDP